MKVGLSHTVAVCIVLGVTGCTRPAEPPSVARLAQILHRARMVEPRLSGRFSFSPCTRLRGPGASVERAECSPLPRGGSCAAVELARLTARVGWWTQQPRSATALQAGGLILLVQGRSARLLDHAVELLSQAAALAPRNATVASDLAAAHLVRAERLDSPRDLVRALARANDALALDPALPAARFNLALARDKLHLRIGAAAAWSSYVALDGHSGWAGEARRRLAAVGAPSALELWPDALERLRQAAAGGDDSATGEVVRRFTQAVRLYVWEEALPEWAALHGSGHEAEARRALELSRRVGRAHRAAAGDSLIEETVSGIAAAYTEPGSPRLAALAAGLREYRLGARAYDRNAMTESESHLAKAAAALHRASSPFAGAAEISLAISSYQQEDYRGALERLRRVTGDRAHRGHPSLLGRAAWIEGLCQLAAGRPFEATGAFERSLAAFAAVHEQESAIALHSMLANALGVVGEQGRAWTHRFAALAGAQELRSLRRRHGLNGSAAMAALDLGLPGAALDFQDEAVALALRSGNPLDIAEELRARAAVEQGLGRGERAVTDLRRALALGMQLEPRVRSAVLAEIDDVEARLRRAREPQRAIELQRAAIELFRQTGYRGRLAASYLELAQAERAAGATDAAERSLAAGIGVQEQEWHHVMEHLDERSGRGVWTRYFEKGRALFDEFTDLQARAGRPADAFDSSERSHSWEVLLQLLAMPAPPRGIGRPAELRRAPQPLLALQAGLAPGTVLLEYRLLDGEALCWTVRRERARLHVLALGPAAIRSLVGRLDAILALAASEAGLLKVLAALHQALLAPVRGELRPGDELIFIPDRSLSRIPFASLWDRAAGRFLVEDFAVGVAPSADLYGRAVAHDRQLATRRPQTALVVRSPSFRRELFAQLAPLAGAESEGAEVAALYPGAESIAGGAATRDRVIDALGRHVVVHFAGHAVTLADNPLVSVLPLAPVGEADSGALYAYELLGRPLTRTRLVVLASCATAGEAGPEAEAISGFVRPLLGDGVPAVVASLWPVDDRVTAELFRIFHRRFRAGDAATQALRSAQLALLRRPGAERPSPRLWAGFEVFGGSAGVGAAAGRR